MLSPATSFSWCKPYNPILGEVFKCRFDHNDSVTHYISEQISHHPPITAIHLKNDKYNYQYTGSILLGGKFYGNSADNVFSGEHIIQLLDLKGKTTSSLILKIESYKFTFPNVTAYGILIGKGRLETTGELTVKCAETGYSSTIKFSGSNYGEGEVLNKEGKAVYQIYGNLDKQMILKNLETKKESIFVEYTILETRSAKIVAPLDKQDPNESRRVWHKITKNLINKKIEEADKEKKFVEQSQRDKVKKKDEKEKHVPKYFKAAGYEVNGAPVYEYIGKVEEVKEEENVIDVDLD
jgi:oxysterol-binding protein-related protein 8